ncbi:MAG: prepilin-type N-terminal cleavage/methylation domain-containing protein, partial [Myxococcota bacterium]
KRPVPPVTKRSPAPVAGYTLLELMVVVVIIGVLAALTAPAVGAALADRRVAQAAQDVVRLTRRGRSEAMALGRAHVLRFNQDWGDGTPAFRLYAGINNSCNANLDAWQPIFTAAAADCSNRFFCVDDSYIGSFFRPRFTAAAAERVVVVSALGDEVQFCFEPNGITRWRTGTTDAGTRFLGSNNATLDGAAVFTFQRETDQGLVGVVRQVVIPLGADARVVR